MSTIKDTDYLLVNRGGTDYKILAADLGVVEYPAGLVIDTVGNGETSWSPYIRLQNYNTKALYDPDQVYWYETDQKPDNIFNDNEIGSRDFAFRWASTEYCELEFKPPGGIRVYSTFELLAGFARASQTGWVTINGVDTKQHAAWDAEPEWFTVPFNGTLDSFAIRQKTANYDWGPDADSWSGCVANIRLDGNLLLNGEEATMLTFKPSAFFDKIKVGTRLRQESPVVEGVVSEVKSGYTVVLDGIYPFQPGKAVTIVGDIVEGALFNI